MRVRRGACVLVGIGVRVCRLGGEGRLRPIGTAGPGHGMGDPATDSARARKGSKGRIGWRLSGICPVCVPDSFYIEGWVLAREKRGRS